MSPQLNFSVLAGVIFWMTPCFEIDARRMQSEHPYASLLGRKEIHRPDSSPNTLPLQELDCPNNLSTAKVSLFILTGSKKSSSPQPKLPL